MDRIRKRRTRVQPLDAPPVGGPSWKRLRKKGGSGEYPPDDGYSNHTWSRNVICVPCRYSARYAGWTCRHPRARHPQLCPTCRSPLMPMPHRFSTPRKQDRWWTSADATGKWARHLADVASRELAIAARKQV